MSNRRALVLSYYPPEPDRDSGSRRLLDLIDLLAGEGQAVSFLAANGIPDRRRARLLEQRGVSVFDATRISVEQFVAEGRFDLALISFWQIAERYLPMLRRVSPTTRVVVDSVDLQFIREARRTLGPESDGGLLHTSYGDEMIGELNVYAAADLVLTVSSIEAQIVSGLLGTGHPVRSVPDIEELAQSTLPFEQRKGIVFIGSFRHPPNADALKYLRESIIPLLDPDVLAEHPVSIVGDGLSDVLKARARRTPHLRMIGWVPSVLPYLEHARISVVPLRFGAGTKRKMIQALALGTPTVTSSVGAEGLDLRSGEHVLLADDPAEFARAMTTLLHDQDLWNRLSTDGHRHIGAAHGRAAVRSTLTSALQEVALRPPKPQRLPELDESSYSRRVRHQQNQRILPLIRDVVRDCIRPKAVVAVASEGDDELLRLGPSVIAWHFPQDPAGRPTGAHPTASADAVAHLQELQERGAEYLVVPATSAWWLDHYAEFAAHLRSTARLVANHDGLVTIFELSRGDRAVTVVEERDRAGIAALDDTSAARLVAFYLPQFHPIPENDTWWGEGFTEWTNVAAATPLFPGHEQPHLPADLGFYDLRLAETREQQATLARAHGISAFCYYHYWFHGKQLLDRPFNEVLTSGKPDMPFCLCWANEPWSRRWDGQPHDVLQPQTYSHEDDVAHIRSLLPALRDPRALTVNGKPVFLVYQGKDLPDPARTVDTWRTEVDGAGLPGLWLMTVETGWDVGWDATEAGFDAKVLFQPEFTTLFGLPRLSGTETSSLRVYDYQQAWRVLAEPEPVDYRRYDTVFPTWDNTPRRGAEGVVLHNSTPDAYAEWLGRAIERVRGLPLDERLVFVNAWNEWGEGCHLEPDQRHGLAYLEATSAALRDAAAASTARRAR